MWSFTHQTLLTLHIVIGSISLFTFWLPLMTKKGGNSHKKYGKVFVYSMLTVAISGIIMSTMVLLDPIGTRYPNGLPQGLTLEPTQTRIRLFALFLWMLSLLVLVNVRQAILVLKAKQNRQLLRTPLHLGLIILLGISGVFVAYLGWQFEQILLMVFGGLSFFLSISSLTYILRAEIAQRQWLLEHIGNILGAGIGVYTAFFAFGGRKLLEFLFSGQWQTLPWLLPSMVGVPAIICLSRKYQRLYKVVKP